MKVTEKEIEAQSKGGGLRSRKVAAAYLRASSTSAFSGPRFRADVVFQWQGDARVGVWTVGTFVGTLHGILRYASPVPFLIKVQQAIYNQLNPLMELDLLVMGSVAPKASALPDCATPRQVFGKQHEPMLSHTARALPAEILFCQASPFRSS